MYTMHRMYDLSDLQDYKLQAETYFNLQRFFSVEARDFKVREHLKHLCVYLTYCKSEDLFKISRLTY